MTPSQVLELFTQCEALLEGHFILSSGRHSPGYLQSARVLQHPEHAKSLGEALALRVKPWAPDLVISPALGGLIIGHEVARALRVRAIFAERVDGRLTLRRGFAITPGERVLVVEDVVTTGGSTRETMEVAGAAEGEVVGAAALINRGGSAIRLEVPFEALADVSWPTHEAAACPLCQQGVPPTKPGSRSVPA